MIEFFMFGLLVNIAGGVLYWVSLNIKLNSVSKHDRLEYESFIRKRSFISDTSNPPFRKLCMELQSLLPGFLFVTSMVAIFFHIRYSGIVGLVAGAVNSDKITMFPMVGYTLGDK